jgi:hypothetical protein
MTSKSMPIYYQNTKQHLNAALFNIGNIVALVSPVDEPTRALFNFLPIDSLMEMFISTIY